MSTKKILFVMQLPPPIHGASVMNKLIQDSKLINSSFNCEYINLATAKDIADLQKNRFSKYIHTLTIVLKAFFKMSTTRYEYVYVTLFPYGPAFIKDSIIVIMARILGLKTLLHLHTYGFKEGAQRSKVWSRYYKFVFKKTEVICLSKLLTEDIEFIHEGKIHILPNGIPQVNFENKYKNDSDPLTILFLSNLIKAKGILILMDALEIVYQKGLKFHFRIVGAERDVTYSELKKLVEKKGIESYVSFAGPKYQDEKHEEYKRAGMFLLPSNYDTFGLVLLEAMQFGVPCISTNIGGIPDVLGDGRGVIIKEIKPKDLAEAIEDLIKNPGKRLEMSKKSFEYFRENYTDKVFEKRLSNILLNTPELVTEMRAGN